MFGATITRTFEKVSFRRKKTVKCSGGCGRRLTRSREFLQTLSPFNKNKDGNLKTESEIYTELLEKAKKWDAESEEICIHCE